LEPRRAEGLSGPGKALDGKPKFDLTKLDAAYFERLRSRVQAAGERGIYVSIMLDPEGKEAWQGRSGGKFDPFNSKYVVVGSRKTDMAPGGLGGGSTQVRLDYQGKDAMTAQLEEILEKYWYPAVPTCLVRNEGGYSVLPLAASEEAKQKP
jgi:hypothetical protein